MALLQSRLFSQLLGVIDRHYFGRLVREAKAEQGAKGFGTFIAEDIAMYVGAD